jgi:hypothetical protein
MAVDTGVKSRRISYELSFKRGFFYFLSGYLPIDIKYQAIMKVP